MADMTAMADILNDDPADATDVQSNFQILEAYINGSEILKTDGTNAMAADLDAGGFNVTNVANGSADDDAMAYGQRPRLVYHGTGSQATTTTATAISIDTEVFDIGTYGAAGSGVITVPSDGVYAFSIELTHSSGSGTALIQDTYTGTIATNVQVNSVDTAGAATTVAYLNASDTFSWQCSYDSFGGSTSTFSFIIKVHKLV